MMVQRTKLDGFTVIPFEVNCQKTHVFHLKFNQMSSDLNMVLVNTEESLF